MGLCNKLVGVNDFDQLINMAIDAKDTQGVDLLFKDYYAEEKVTKVKEKFVCISLASVAQMTTEDLATVE